MMAGIASGLIEDTPAAQQHLDHCLSCQACEAACPAKVPYLSLLDAHRASQARRRSFASRRLQKLLTVRQWRPALRLALRVAQWTRPFAQWLSRVLHMPTLRRQLSLLPDHRTARLPRFDPQCDVYIFAGCMGDIANAPAANALLDCCKALNIRASILPTGLCCGALTQHQGDPDQANQLRQQLAEFADIRKPLVVLDSACANQLRDSGWQQVEEACHFLNRQTWPTVTKTLPTQQILIHQPCSHRNGLREADAARELLSRAPHLELHDIADPLCCGAAGTHMLDFPQRAELLRQSKLDPCIALQPSALVTTNIGCAVHLAAGLRLHDDAPLPTVCHPVELIARCLEPV